MQLSKSLTLAALFGSFVFQLQGCGGDDDATTTTGAPATTAAAAAAATTAAPCVDDPQGLIGVSITCASLMQLLAGLSTDAVPLTCATDVGATVTASTSLTQAALGAGASQADITAFTGTTPASYCCATCAAVAGNTTRRLDFDFSFSSDLEDDIQV